MSEQQTQNPQDRDFIAGRLRFLRGELTQTQFAKSIGVSRDALANYETGRTIPSSQTIEKIAERLSLPPSFFDQNYDPSAITLGSYLVGRRAVATSQSAPSADEKVILSVFRVSEPSRVAAALQTLLTGLLSPSGVRRIKDPDQAKKDIERLIQIVEAGGVFDRSPSNHKEDPAYNEMVGWMQRRLNDLEKGSG